MQFDTEHTKEFLKLLIGQPPEGSHPDEWGPRADSWHAERLNWKNEVDRLRAQNRIIVDALVELEICDFNKLNCNSLETASRRVQSAARAALALAKEVA